MNYSIPYTYPLVPHAHIPFSSHFSPHHHQQYTSHPHPAMYHYSGAPLPPYPYPYPMVPPPTQLHSIPLQQQLHHSKRIKKDDLDKEAEGDTPEQHGEIEKTVGSNITTLPLSASVPYPHFYQPLYHHPLFVQKQMTHDKQEEGEEEPGIESGSDKARSKRRHPKRSYSDENSSDVQSSFSRNSLEEMKPKNMNDNSLGIKQDQQGQMAQQPLRVGSSYGPAADKLKKEGLKTACEFCTKRKIKCIKVGESLTCNFCLERGFPCTFIQHKKRGRPRIHYLILDTIKDELKKQKELEQQQKNQPKEE